MAMAITTEEVGSAKTAPGRTIPAIGFKSAQRDEIDWYTTNQESAKLQKIDGEWTSLIEEYEDNAY